MSFDIYSPMYMEGLIREKGQEYTFIRSRYFGGAPVVFATEEVMIDYDDGEGNLLAPFVVPRVGSVPIMREGYETKSLKPPYIAPSRQLSIDDLVRRRAGESIVSTMTPAERERQYLIDDLDTLDRMITRTEEWECINTMLDNACTMHHLGNNGEKGVDMEARFYDGTTNKAVFTPSATWDVGTETTRGVWYKDVQTQIKAMKADGRPVTDLLVGANVADMILNDPWVVKMLDNRRINLGEIDPTEQAPGVTYIGRLNFGGTRLDILCYEGIYEERTIDKKGNVTKETKEYMPADAVILTAPNVGIMRYGAVTQVEMDNNTYTRTGSRVPKYLCDVKSNQKELILTSRPLAAPKIKNPWRSCRNVMS